MLRSPRVGSTGTNRSFISRLLLPSIVLGLSVPVPLRSQVVQNGDFDGAVAHWGCSPNIMLQLLAGGADIINLVDVLGGGANIFSTADDSRLCQTVEGFEIGRTYYLGFHATRAFLSPTSVGVRVRVDGTPVDQIFTRTGAYGMSYSQVSFTATSTSHVIRFDPTTQALWGVVLDNITIYRVSPLPIELVSFDAMPGAGQVDLSWTTASETDNAFFSVERSRDNATWTTVATVAGQEHSQTLLSYASVDLDPPMGHVYYRLRQTDLNGASTCSMVKVVLMEAVDNAPQLWPNPATDRVHVAGTAIPVAVDVLDAQGRRITLPVQPSSDGLSVDVSALPPGRYVMVLGEDGQRATFIHQ